MAKNILSQVFPSDTVVSSLVAQTRLDDVFVHCETNNRLAISSCRIVMLASIAVYSPSIFEDIAAGKTNLIEVTKQTLRNNVPEFDAAFDAFLNAHSAALEAKEIRRSLFEGRHQNDYVAFTKPNIDRILNVIAKTIASQINAVDMAKVFKGFAFIANFLSNGRVAAEQAEAILKAAGFVETETVEVKEVKVIKAHQPKVLEAPKTTKGNSIATALNETMEKLNKAANNSEFVKRSRESVKVVSSKTPIASALAHAGDFGVVNLDIKAPSCYATTMNKLTKQLKSSEFIKRSIKTTPKITCTNKAEPIEKPNNDVLLAADKPLVNEMGFFEVYKLKDGYKFNLTNLICKYLVYIRDNLATEAGKHYVESVSLNISTDQRYQGFKHGTTKERIKVRAYNHYTGDYKDAARDLYPLDYVVNKSASLKYVLLNALMTETDNLGLNEHAYDDAAKFLDIYFAALNDLLEGKVVDATKQEAAKQSKAEKADKHKQYTLNKSGKWLDNMAYLTEAEEQKLGEYACKIGRPVATLEEQQQVCKAGYLEPISCKDKDNELQWRLTSFGTIANLCREAGINIPCDYTKAEILTPIYHGGDKGVLFKPLAFIGAYTSTLHFEFNANTSATFKLATNFMRKLKALLSDSASMKKRIYDNGNDWFIPLNDFESGFGASYMYDKVIKLLYKESLKQLKDMNITETQMACCLEGLSKLYRAMYYIFVQDNFWQYGYDPKTNDYCLTPHNYNHWANVA